MSGHNIIMLKFVTQTRVMCVESILGVFIWLKIKLERIFSLFLLTTWGLNLRLFEMLTTYKYTQDIFPLTWRYNKCCSWSWDRYRELNTKTYARTPQTHNSEPPHQTYNCWYLIILKSFLFSCMNKRILQSVQFRAQSSLYLKFILN